MSFPGKKHNLPADGPDQEHKGTADDIRLSSQIGEEERPKDLLRRLVRENRLAVFSAVVILAFVLGAVFAPLIAPYAPDEMDILNRLSSPSAVHIFGTDEGGRDVFSRMLYGSRASLLIGVVPTLMSLVGGTFVGLLAGYHGGVIDTVIMRLADIMLAFPSMLLAMVILYTLGGGLINVFLTLAMVGWASVARMTRAEAMRLKNTEFVESARVSGVGRVRIILRHLLPNCFPMLTVLFTLNIPASILTESSLSFLGLGIQPPHASWGLMINTGRQYLFNAPWLCFIPGAAIMLIVLAFNFLGDGLRDVLDPQNRSS